MSKRFSNASSSSRDSGAAPQLTYRSEVRPAGASAACSTAARIVGTAEIATGSSSATVCQNVEAEKRSHITTSQPIIIGMTQVTTCALT